MSITLELCQAISRVLGYTRQCHVNGDGTIIMYQDIINYTHNCPQCALGTGVGRRPSPPMKSIPVDHPFQIVGIDIMELPLTTNGNKYPIVFHYLFTIWPVVYSFKQEQ